MASQEKISISKLEPNLKEAYTEMLHKKDMKNQVSFCDLSMFGDMLTDKAVRDRAIKERIEAIKVSIHSRRKFEQ